MLNRCTEMYIPWKSRSRKACVNFESACIIPWKLGTYSTSLIRDSEASDYLSTCKLDGVWIFKLDYHSMINHQWTWFTQLTDTQKRSCFMSWVPQKLYWFPYFKTVIEYTGWSNKKKRNCLLLLSWCKLSDKIKFNQRYIMYKLQNNKTVKTLNE